MSELLSTRKLSKRYGGKYALLDADVHVRRGEIYGLIGRNGAGKTTLLKLINSQINATSGEIIMAGRKMRFGRPEIRIGALVESPGLYPDYSAYDNLRFKSLVMGAYNPGRLKELLKVVELQDTGKKKAKQFSLGMKQRLAIALALIGEPELLILDEPINGMDPQGIKDIREMLVRLNRQQGVTILISSHILDELAKFATSYGIIKDGRVLREFTRQQLEEENRAGIEIETEHPDQVIRALEEAFQIRQFKMLGDGRLLVQEGLQAYRQISRLLFDQGIHVAQLFVRHESLEDYFMGMTGGGAQ